MNFCLGGPKIGCCNETLSSTHAPISWNSAGAGHGKRVSYFGESRIPFSKSLLQRSLLMGCPVFFGFFFEGGGGKMHKCLSVYYHLLLQLSSRKPCVEEQLIGVCVMWAERVHGVTVLVHLSLL